MKKILFVIENLGAGGAERVLINLVNNMDRSEFDITIVTLFDKGVNAESLSGDIRHINLNLKKFRGIKTILKFLPSKLLYRLYLKPHIKENYDLTVAYMTGVPTFIVAGADTPKIAWVHGEFFDDFNSFGLRHIYNRFDKIVGVSKHVCKTVADFIRPDSEPLFIWNTNDTKRIERLSKENIALNSDRLNLVTVGCLEQTKGFDRLINVCKKLSDNGYEFNLNILGEGIERKNLEALIHGNNMDDYVHLIGFMKNPYPYIANADLFICSSRTEGLSTVVTEAIILGTPVVSTDVSGAKEILGNNNEYGLVTENNEDALYEGIRKMLSDEITRKHYAEKALERSKFFDTAATVKQAENLFMNI